MTEGNKNSTYESNIKKDFEEATYDKWWNDSEAWNIKYKEDRNKAEKFLIDQCKNLPELQRKLLIKKIAEKIVYFEKGKSEIEEECIDALGDLKDTIFINNQIRTNGIIKCKDLIINNPRNIRESRDCIFEITKQIQTNNPDIFNIFLSDSKFKEQFDSLWSNNYWYLDYLLYNFSALFIKLHEDWKINDFIQLFSNLKNSNSEGALKIIKEKFNSSNYNVIYNFNEIETLSLNEKKDEINNLKNTLYKWKITDKEIIESSVRAFISDIPKDILQNLLSFFSKNESKSAKEIVSELVQIWIDYYHIRNFYWTLYTSFDWIENKWTLYKEIMKIAENQTWIDKKLLYKVETNLDKKIKMIFSDEISLEKEKQLNTLINNFVINWEIHWVLEFKKWLKEIFKWTEFESKIDWIPAWEFLQMLIDYNDTKIAKNIDNMKSLWFNEEKFNNISEEEKNDILELNNQWKTEEVIEKLILLWIIIKPKNKEELDLIKANLKEYLIKTNQNKVFKKNLSSPERLSLLQDVLDGTIIEWSKEYTEKLTKIQEKEKIDWVNTSKNETGLNEWPDNIDDLLSEKEKFDAYEFARMRNHPNTLIKNIWKWKVEIIFETWEILNCNSNEVRNLVEVWIMLEEIGLGFLINSIPKSDNSNMDFINAFNLKWDNFKLDFSNWLNITELRLFLWILWRALFGNEFPVNWDIKEFVSFFKRKKDAEWDNSLESILKQKNIYVNWTFLRQNFINQIKN